MKLRRLTLSNFRGFEQIELKFSEKVTAIAGVNGVGKSAVLQAISKIASYLLPKITAAKKETSSFSDSDIHAGKLTMSIGAAFEIDDSLEILGNISRTQVDPSLVSDIREERENIRASRRYVEKNSPEDLQFEERLQELEELLKSSEDYFSWHADKERLKIGNPLIVYYSTNRSLSRLPPRLSQVKPLSTASAYANALKGTEVSLNDFANWYRAAQKGLLGSKKVSQSLFEILEDVIHKMLPDFHHLQLVDDSRPYFTIQKQGSLLELEQLSDGERGLLALTFDLTRRLTTANPTSNNPVEEGSAIVLIDEIELHLHPSWQRKVLRKLTSTFKNCQFIVTTHSPQVIGQTKAEKLRLLYKNDERRISVTTPSQAFGMDSSWILENIMGTPARDLKTEQDLGDIFDAIDEENYPHARQLVEKMLSELGEFPELDEAGALLDRLELLEDYEED
jgi:predicted ATP-binding protein involved in virulence